MQPCETVDCGKWIAYGTHCAKHEPVPSVVITTKRKGFHHPTLEDRAGVPAIDATEVRVTERERATTPKPWTHVRGGTKALSDCTVTRADGSSYIIPANRRTRKPTEAKRHYIEVDHTTEVRTKLLSIAGAANRNHDYNAQ